MKQKLIYIALILSLLIPLGLMSCDSGNPEGSISDLTIRSGGTLDVSAGTLTTGDVGVNGDISTDRYLGSSTNTLLGVGAAGAGNLTHGSESEGWYNTAVGNNALSTNSTGNYNSALGGDALRTNSTGNSNSALGANALSTNSTGDFNSALGVNALRTNSTGDSNSALGVSALRLNDTGSNNTALGRNALRTNSTGTSNSVLGADAGYSALGSGNIFLGYQSGYNETGSNKLYIDNSNTATPLIYGEFDSDLVAVNGDLLVKDSYVELDEMTAPGAGAANTARIYAVEDGGGLTDLAAVYQDGTIDVFSQETTPLDSPIFTEADGTTVEYVMRKPHPGLIQFGVVFPSGEFFPMRELEYHDADKIAANTGCTSDKLPGGWEVTTVSQRVSVAVDALDAKINKLQAAIDMATDRLATAEPDDLPDITDGIAKMNSQLTDLQNQKMIELSRIEAVDFN